MVTGEVVIPSVAVIALANIAYVWIKSRNNSKNNGVMKRTVEELKEGQRICQECLQTLKENDQRKIVLLEQILDHMR